MATNFPIYLFLFALTIGCATSARFLDQVGPQFAFPTPIVVDQPDTFLPSGQVPVVPVVAPIDTTPVADVAHVITTTPIDDNEVAPVVTTTPIDDNDVAPPVVNPPVADVAAPVVNPPVADVAPPAINPPVAPIVAPNVATPVVANVATGTTPAATSSSSSAGNVANAATGTTPVATSSSSGTGGALSFFMHDILGGSRPSGRVVTGIVANSNVNNLPFSKTNSQVFPINGGVPLNTLTGVINNNNMPFLVGLNGQQNVAGANSVIQNAGNNNVASVNGNGNLPFVSAGQLPAGLTLQQVMFGSITVVDNELTEGHELDSAVLGRAQGFYLASSLDGTGHTLVLTALFHAGDHHEIEDTISFFGIHRTGSPESQIAVVGGTGKYEHAKGYATIVTLHQQDQHTTDGVETITQFNVYLTYMI